MVFAWLGVIFLKKKASVIFARIKKVMFGELVWDRSYANILDDISLNLCPGWRVNPDHFYDVEGVVHRNITTVIKGWVMDKTLFSLENTERNIILLKCTASLKAGNKVAAKNWIKSFKFAKIVTSTYVIESEHLSGI